MSFLKTKKFALVGFYPFDYKLGGLHTNIYLSDEPKVPCSYFESLNEKSKELVLYNCIVEFLEEDKKNADLELTKILAKQTYRTKKDPIQSIPLKMDYNSSSAKYFKAGTSVNQLKATGNDTSVSKENLRNFLITFLSTVRHSGVKEVESLLNIEYSSNDQACNCPNTEKIFQKVTGMHLKKFDVDYWIIAHHSQTPDFYPNANGDIDYGSLKRLSLIPALFTYGTFPYWDDEVFESKFYIYDKNLNLMKTFEYKNKTTFSVAWWIDWRSENTDKGTIFPPISVYEPDVKKFTKEVYNMVKNK